MKPASIIGHVREAAHDFLEAPDRPADQRLREFYRGRRYLGSRDRRQISGYYYGLLRRFRRYLPYATTEDHDRDVPPPESVPPVLALLLSEESDVARSDILEGCRVDEGVLARLLATCAAAAGGSGDEILSMNRGFPAWFVDDLRRGGLEDISALLESLDGQADIGIRFDPRRISREDLLRQFDEAGYGQVVESSVWTEYGLVMTERGVLSKVPAIRKGGAVVQDIGSQMISLAADPQPGWKVLDACAGAGGKTLHLADLLDGTGCVVAHDAVPSRLDRLVGRMSGSQRQNVEVIYPDELDRRVTELHDSFDLVLVDAPCSGTGTFRRNPGLKLTLRPGDVSDAVGLQREIIEKYSRFVRPGGRLLYATCSLLAEENEAVVEWFLSRNGARFAKGEIGSIPSAMTENGVMRIRPDRHGTDGFFAALLERAT